MEIVCINLEALTFVRDLKRTKKVLISELKSYLPYLILFSYDVNKNEQVFRLCTEIAVEIDYLSLREFEKITFK